MPVIALSGVGVAYHGVEALRDVSLRIDAGERVALIGPSGAGKSTLLGLITGRIAPTTGAVEVFGRSLDSLSARELRAIRRRIGTIHQAYDLVEPLRVIHNVNAGRLGRWSTPRALLSLLRPVGRDDVVAALDILGIPELADARTSELSGGQRQRVAIARVLVHAPEIVLADEPISSLDPERGHAALERLIEDAERGGRTLVASLHDVGAALGRFPRLVGIRDGRVVFDRARDAIGPEEIEALYRVERSDSAARDTRVTGG